MDQLFLASKKYRQAFCPQREGYGPISDSKYDFTPCFDSAISDIPSLFIIVFGAYEIFKLSRVRDLGTRKDWHFWTKIVATFGVLVTSVILAVIQANLSYRPLEDIRVWSYVSSALGITFALAIHYLEQSRRRVSSGILITFWWSKLIVDSIKLRSIVFRGFPMMSHADESFLFVPFLVHFVFTVIVWGLQSFVAKANSDYVSLHDEEYKYKCPVEEANILSKITFQWLTPIMRQGYNHFLTEDDLTDLRYTDKCKVVSDDFERLWAATEKKSVSRLWIALAKLEGGTYLAAAFCKGVQDVLAFVQPQLLRMLISFVNSYDTDTPDPKIKGFAIAISMFLVSLFQSAFLHQYFQRAFEVGMRIRSALTSTIYKKSLVLNSEGRAEKSTGDIVNLMSVDTQRVSDLTQYGQIVWSAPFQIILCLISLYQLVGISMIAGIVIMVIMIPINAFVSKIMKNNQKAQMKNKDARTRLTTEILSNIKTIKLYAWEPAFLKKLFHVRNDKELRMLKKIGVLNAIANFTWSTAPILVSCSTFAVYTLVNKKPLTTDIVFPALTLFNLLSFPLAVLPQVITSIIESVVAVERLVKFLASGELQQDAVVREEAVKRIGQESVKIVDGNFHWGSKNEPTLKDINFSAHKGELSCVVGSVGAGKSSFLQACLGELHKSQGTVTTRGTVAYVAQSPWIMNASVRTNIVFGHKFDPQFYQRTVEACALSDDFKALPDGDETEVGEKGISLSGGQKARISLARAVYSRADVFFLDDPLSAVDQHVGKHLVHNVLGPQGLLKSKTRVLATNYVPVLSEADNILLLKNNVIFETGTYDDIISGESSELSRLIKEFGKKSQDKEDETSSDEQTMVQSSSSNSSEDEVAHKKRRESTITLRRASAASFKRPHGQILDEERSAPKLTGVLAEFAEQGNVKWIVYKEYIKACSVTGVMFFLGFLFASQGAQVASSVWLKNISSQYDAGGNVNSAYLLGIYALLGIGASALTMCYTLILWIFCSVRSSKILHENMANAVFQAPMTFFETTPMGRILNRFSTDVYKIDEVLPRTFSMFFRNAVQVCFVLGVICISTPVFTFLIIPLVVVYYGIQKYYLKTSRELKRLDSTTRSPIYAHFQESLGGISTIRAYNQQGRFAQENEWRMDMNQKAWFLYIATNRWLAVRLEFIGSFIILAAAILAVTTVFTTGMSAGLVGLSMSYALQTTQSLNWIVRQTVEVETNIVSAERALEYAHLESEAPAVTSFKSPAAWPTSGAVEFKGYSTRYREGLPLILNEIDVKIKSHEKIGIVGRTGAGKSSLTMALFRVIEAAAGNITIDGVDTSKLGLRDLRSKLAIIPQDAQAFEGTLRENLDPSGDYDDTEMYSALRRVQLIPDGQEHAAAGSAEVVESNMFTSLDSTVGEAGGNMSAGQKQLMTLARGLLRRSPVVIMDEATSSIDFGTDKMIQKILKTEFDNSTVLCIAHRLSTVIHYDRILVLDYGKVKEFDSPKNLLKNPNSLFTKLAESSGELDTFKEQLGP
ncbi:putative ABC metal ion transporter [Taphrina deformans PYCC 5710]|uniref:ABC metal ion transporter n=1 Tax=Taphrina deformans (strain PYCC 5710 / ATCC 11124 / CBS 356.35 / IMI 108563 / JCM 9778 / NBRC 8474) TaxID=1097556 RepID=R4XDB1_TAPDE|nr:putative ABC metal ion transporter [Taphrina deformans PYCC 5710]|eukprot:CCG82393.1 putative ABC metal ion transporter [Taphrina deformans PYCC 5710]